MEASIRNIRKMGEKVGHRTGLVAACPIHPWERYSADAGDYFMARDEAVLKCSCGEPLVLARFREEMESS